MDVRENLIEILLQKPSKCTFEQLADFLIDHGVTVQSEIDANTLQIIRECERLKEEKESLANAINVLEEINSDLCKKLKVATVQDGKPLKEFLHPIDSYKGLKAKYLVFKADTGEMVDNCFTLRPDKDASAVEALRAYANATDNEILAEDIYNWVGKGKPAHPWISVKNRLPSKDGCYLVAVTDDHDRRYFKITWFSCNGGSWFPKQNVTHWMPLSKLPKPPKGE